MCSYNSVQTVNWQLIFSKQLNWPGWEIFSLSEKETQFWCVCEQRGGKEVGGGKVKLDPSKSVNGCWTWAIGMKIFIKNVILNLNMENECWFNWPEVIIYSRKLFIVRTAKNHPIQHRQLLFF